MATPLTPSQTATPSETATPSQTAAGAANAGKRPRDVRLDFFRGIGMFIIFMAHTPGNTWTLWIPARFGFSDATEIFVFCSGMASALAFGAVFDRLGWVMGCVRVAHRMWQVYWAHICLFLIIAAQTVVMTQWSGIERNYMGALNLLPFFNDNTPDNLVGLLTLTYVPNYFDILPMYLVILALLPIVMLLGSVHPVLAGAWIAGLWLLATFEVVDFPAEPWSDRAWFFNPFGWQLIFFTGFAFIRGWLPAPPISRGLVYLAAGVVLVSLPFAYERMYWVVGALEPVRPAIYEVRGAIGPLIEKSDFGLFRYLHFLALAYLAYAWAGAQGVSLVRSGWIGTAIDMVRQVGQQSLAVFLASLVIAQAMGFVLKEFGNGNVNMVAVNVGGIVLLYVTARIAAYFKSQPWRQKRQNVDTPRRIVAARSAEPPTSRFSPAE